MKKEESFNWKEFLKFDWKKTILIFIFTLLTFLYFQTPSKIATGFFRDEYHGLPLPFYHYLIGFRPLPTQEIEYTDISKFLYSNLIIDLIFWYIISCFLIWIYKKVKKK